MYQELYQPLTPCDTPDEKPCHHYHAATDSGTFEYLQAVLEDDCTRVADPIHKVAVGENIIWGLTQSGRLYQLSEKRWIRYPCGGMFIRDISVTSRGLLFALSEKGHVYRMNKQNQLELFEVEQSKNLKSISARSRTSVYGITYDNVAVCTHMSYFRKCKWRPLGQVKKLNKISVGSNELKKNPEIWGLTTDHHACCFYNGEMWIYDKAKLVDIAVSSDNQVFGLNENGRLVKWDGEEDFVEQEVLITKDGYPALNSIAVYQDVYAVEKCTGNLLKLFL